MQLKQLLNNDNAVSPVIGVILMVAITVILAAVIGTFVLGLGDQVQTTTPQATFTESFTDNTGDDKLTVTAEGGDKISSSELSWKFTGVKDESGNSYSDMYYATTGWSTTPVTAGSTLTVDSDSDLNTKADGTGSEVAGAATDVDLDLNSATTRLVWTSSNGDSSATLSEWNGPSA